MKPLKRIIRLTLTAISFALLAVPAHSQIAFREIPFEKALETAQKEEKMVFLDAVTATCPPCRRMERFSFTDPKVTALFEQHFVNIKLDLNKGEGPNIQQQYNITDFPTLLLLDGKGELVEVHVGFLDAEQLLAFGNSVLAPDFMPLSELQAQFEAEPSSRILASAYIIRQGAAGQDVEAVWKDFRPGMAGKELLKPENWEVFRAKIRMLDDVEAHFFVENRKKFEKKYGKAIVREKFFALHRWGMKRAIFKNDAPRYKAIRKQMTTAGLPEAEQEALYLDLDWYLQAGDWDQFFHTALSLESLNALPNNLLGFIASNLCDGASKPEQLAQALKWSKRAVADEASYGHLDTQFRLLIRLEKTEEAIEVGRAAIKAAKASKAPYGDTEAALNKLEAGR